MDELTRKVLEHYLQTGQPLVLDRVQVRDAPEGCEPIGAWSQDAQPLIGWEPTKRVLREHAEILQTVNSRIASPVDPEFIEILRACCIALDGRGHPDLLQRVSDTYHRLRTPPERPSLFRGAIWCGDCNGDLHADEPCDRCEATPYDGPARLRTHVEWVIDGPDPYLQLPTEPTEAE